MMTWPVTSLQRVQRASMIWPVTKELIDENSDEFSAGASPSLDPGISGA
jgi:hypothetical protein